MKKTNRKTVGKAPARKALAVLDREESGALVAQPVSGYLPLLQAAINKDIDIDKLERLMALQERWEAKQAEKSFNLAMAGFQADMPPISPDTLVDADLKLGGKLTYRYAKLGHILRVANPIMQRYGLSARFNSVVKDGWIDQTCTISHADGHAVDTHFGAPTDSSMRVNDTQKMGSANSYTRRYSFCNAMNIVVVFDDDDGAASMKEITGHQVVQLRDLLESTGIDEAVFCRFMGVDQVESITGDMHEKAREFVSTWKAARKSA